MRSMVLLLVAVCSNGVATGAGKLGWMGKSEHRASAPARQISGDVSIWSQFEGGDPATFRLVSDGRRAYLVRSMPVPPPGKTATRRAEVPLAVFRSAMSKVNASHFWRLRDEKTNASEEAAVAGWISVSVKTPSRKHSVRFYAHYTKPTYAARYDPLVDLLSYLARLDAKLHPVPPTRR
jgi:hypothetical protein